MNLLKILKKIVVIIPLVKAIIKAVKGKKKRYWLSFTEEMVMNTDPKYDGYIAGRIEVYDNEKSSPYAEEEIRFFTKKQDRFHGFREVWDWQNLDEKELKKFKVFVKENYCDKTC